MMATTYPRHMQLWPGGECVSVLDVGEDQFKIKTDKAKRFRKPTPDEVRRVRIEELAERYQQSEIHFCDTALVSDLLQAAQSGELGGDLEKAFDYENVKNLRPNPEEWTVEECKAWLDDAGYGLPDPNPWAMTEADLIGECIPSSELEEFQSSGGLPDAVKLLAIALKAINDEDVLGINEWREAVRDNATDAEIYQWFRVSTWLADELDAIGECVLDNDYGDWWGRGCCGQALIMDGTLQKIAARHV